MKNTLFPVFSVVLLALLVGLTPLSTHTAHAEVTRSDIETQRSVVMHELIDVLREHVTFLQLVVIDRLEDRVSYLQARVETQK